MCMSVCVCVCVCSKQRHYFAQFLHIKFRFACCCFALDTAMHISLSSLFWNHQDIFYNVTNKSFLCFSFHKFAPFFLLLGEKTNRKSPSKFLFVVVVVVVVHKLHSNVINFHALNRYNNEEVNMNRATMNVLIANHFRWW